MADSLLDTRSDVYSLGAVLYELLTGTLPFDSDTLRAGGPDHIRRVIRDEEPKTPSTRLTGLGEQAARVAKDRRTEVGTLARRLRKELEWIPLKAMRKERDRRYRSASELADDIRNYLAGAPLIAGPESTMYRVRKFVRRNRPLVGGGLALLLVLVAGIVVSTLFAFGQARARGEAQAVSDFLRHSLIESLDPYRVGGREITIRSVLDTASEALEAQLGSKPLAEGQIRQTLGFAYWSQGLNELSESHFRRGLELYRAHAGAEHPMTLELTMNVGWLCYFQGRYDEAADLLAEAVGRMQRVLGPEHPTTLHTMSSLACVYYMQGRFPEALQFSDQAMEAAWRCLDEDQIVQQIAIVAWGYHMTGRHEQAEQLFTRGLDICRRRRGKNDNCTLDLQSYFGQLCTTLGRYGQAEQLLLAALEGRRHAWAQHPAALEAAAALAWCYHAEGRYAEAERLFSETLDTARSQLGDAHALTCTCVHGLGQLCLDQQRYDEAQTLLEPLLRQMRHLGDEHWGLLGLKQTLTRLYTAQGRYARAEQMAREIVETDRRILGNDHPQTLAAVNDLGVLRREQGHYDEAESLLREPLESRQRRLGPDHPASFESMHELAALYLAKKDYAKAEPLALDAFRGRETKLGPDHPHTLGSLNQLVRLYESSGKPAEAEKWRARLGLHDAVEE